MNQLSTVQYLKGWFKLHATLNILIDVVRCNILAKHPVNWMIIAEIPMRINSRRNIDYKQLKFPLKIYITIHTIWIETVTWAMGICSVSFVLMQTSYNISVNIPGEPAFTHSHIVWCLVVSNGSVQSETLGIMFSHIQCKAARRSSFIQS